MRADSNAEYTVNLDDLRHLFSSPPQDPFSEGGMRMSGVDQVAAALKSAHLPERVSIRIVLPREKLDEARRMDPETAIRRYCRFRIGECEVDLAAMRRDGFRALMLGFGLITVCLALATFAGEAAWMPKFGKVFAESFTVLGWVSIWRPAEMLLFDRAPLRRTLRALRIIEGAEISLVARG